MTAKDVQQREDPDDLELEVEKVADLDVSSEAADEVHGASGTPHAINNEVGKQNC